MKILLFGATGMIGQGVLRECLRDPRVTQVLIVGRHAAGQAHPKVRELLHQDFFDFSALEGELSGLDTCFFCLGVSSAGLDEAAYRRVTHDLALAAAGTLARLNPAMTFIYVSGAGTDGTGQGRTMWARVKGQTENALRGLPFRAVHLFRPGVIQPLSGITSRTRWYRVFYGVMGPFFPWLRRLFPGTIITTEELGRAMIRVALEGAPAAVLEARDLIALGGPPTPGVAP
ncbi:epimerase [Geothrix oryzae]|uniref:Epimerase n=1 Tax=Geothrix oryzae TaxID=2927975 RepID=A0ABM8DTJ1_9BACT|nr:epimerase [Geothrix oryzae]BDU70399.1 epimerase [Geothrix oryzae]